MPHPLTCLFLVLLSGCTGAVVPEPRPSPGKAAAITPAGYQGPAIDVQLAGDELRVSVQVKTGGYRLQLRETGRAADHTFVKLSLTAPAADQAVTQALATKVVRVPLEVESGPIHLLLQEVQDGVHYITAPEFTLARIVPR